MDVISMDFICILILIIFGNINCAVMPNHMQYKPKFIFKPPKGLNNPAIKLYTDDVTQNLFHKNSYPNMKYINSNGFNQNDTSNNYPTGTFYNLNFNNMEKISADYEARVRKILSNLILNEFALENNFDIAQDRYNNVEQLLKQLRKEWEAPTKYLEKRGYIFGNDYVYEPEKDDDRDDIEERSKLTEKENALLTKIIQNIEKQFGDDKRDENTKRAQREAIVYDYDRKLDDLFEKYIIAPSDDTSVQSSSTFEQPDIVDKTRLLSPLTKLKLLERIDEIDQNENPTTSLNNNNYRFINPFKIHSAQNKNTTQPLPPPPPTVGDNNNEVNTTEQPQKMNRKRGLYRQILSSTTLPKHTFSNNEILQRFNEVLSHLPEADVEFLTNLIKCYGENKQTPAMNETVKLAITTVSNDITTTTPTTPNVASTTPNLPSVIPNLPSSTPKLPLSMNFTSAPGLLPASSKCDNNLNDNKESTTEQPPNYGHKKPEPHKGFKFNFDFSCVGNQENLDVKGGRTNKSTSTDSSQVRLNEFSVDFELNPLKNALQKNQTAMDPLLLSDIPVKNAHEQVKDLKSILIENPNALSDFQINSLHVSPNSEELINPTIIFKRHNPYGFRKSMKRHTLLKFPNKNYYNQNNINYNINENKAESESLKAPVNEFSNIDHTNNLKSIKIKSPQNNNRLERRNNFGLSKNNDDADDNKKIIGKGFGSKIFKNRFGKKKKIDKKVREKSKKNNEEKIHFNHNEKSALNKLFNMVPLIVADDENNQVFNKKQDKDLVEVDENGLIVKKSNNTGKNGTNNNVIDCDDDYIVQDHNDGTNNAEDYDDNEQFENSAKNTENYEVVDYDGADSDNGNNNNGINNAKNYEIIDDNVGQNGRYNVEHNDNGANNDENYVLVDGTTNNDDAEDYDDDFQVSSDGKHNNVHKISNKNLNKNEDENEIKSFSELKDIKFHVNPSQEEDIERFIKDLNSPKEIFNFDVNKYIFEKQDKNIESSSKKYDFITTTTKPFYAYSLINPITNTINKNFKNQPNPPPPPQQQNIKPQTKRSLIKSQRKFTKRPQKQFNKINSNFQQPNQLHQFKNYNSKLPVLKIQQQQNNYPRKSFNPTKKSFKKINKLEPHDKRDLLRQYIKGRSEYKKKHIISPLFTSSEYQSSSKENEYVPDNSVLTSNINPLKTISFDNTVNENYMKNLVNYDSYKKKDDEDDFLVDNYLLNTGREDFEYPIETILPPLSPPYQPTDPLDKEIFKPDEFIDKYYLLNDGTFEVTPKDSSKHMQEIKEKYDPEITNTNLELNEKFRDLKFLPGTPLYGSNITTNEINNYDFNFNPPGLPNPDFLNTNLLNKPCPETEIDNFDLNMEKKFMKNPNRRPHLRRFNKNRKIFSANRDQAQQFSKQYRRNLN